MLTIMRHTAALCAVLSLGACGSASPHTAQTQKIQSFEGAADVFVPKGTPVSPQKATSLNLEQILVFANTHAPSIQTARARLGFAQAEIVGAAIPLPANPTLSFSGGARTQSGQAGFDFEVAIAQQLEIAGEQGLRRERAQDRLALSRASLNEVRWSVHVEAHRLVVALLLVRQRREQASRFVAFAESMRDIAARQVKAGELSPLLLLVAQTDLARTKEAVIHAKQLDQVLRTRLAAVIGWPTFKLPPLHEALPEIKAAPTKKVLLDRMATHHPSLHTRQVALRAARSNLALQNKEAWIEPTVGLSYSREAGLGPEPADGLWLMTLTLPLPVWHRNQQQRALAHAQVDVSKRQQHANAVDLSSRLIQALARLDTAIERVALYETVVVPKLEQNLALLRRSYELGEVNIHEVSQTRERLLNATGSFIDARVEYYNTAATLEGLVGTELWPEKKEPQ